MLRTSIVERSILSLRSVSIIFCASASTYKTKLLFVAARISIAHHELWTNKKTNKKLIRRWDSERELALRRHRTHTTKYNRLVHKFRHRSTRLEHRFNKFTEITQCNGHYAVQGHSRSPIFIERSHMAKVPNDIETLPKILIAWVRCTNVTDRRQTDERR